MNSGGYSAVLNMDAANYYFQELTISTGCHMQDTPLVSGSLYRTYSSAGAETIRLKGRINSSKIMSYRDLLKALSKRKKEFSINGTHYSNMTLLNGKVSVMNGEEFGVCELVLTEVMS